MLLDQRKSSVRLLKLYELPISPVRGLGISWDNRKGKLGYQAVAQERSERTPDRCVPRADDLGAWEYSERVVFVPRPFGVGYSPLYRYDPMG